MWPGFQPVYARPTSNRPHQSSSGWAQSAANAQSQLSHASQHLRGNSGKRINGLDAAVFLTSRTSATLLGIAPLSAGIAAIGEDNKPLQRFAASCLITGLSVGQASMGLRYLRWRANGGLDRFFGGRGF